MRPPFRRLWTFHGRHLLEFPPVVGYGSVFEEVFDGRLYSLDPASGRVRWRYDSHRCGWSSPALADQLLFATFIGNAECHATRGGGELVALSPETGRVRWRRTIGPSESSPLVADGLVYVGDQDGRVYAFASGTGRLRWSFDTGAPIKASPSLAYGRIYIGNYAGEFLALDARIGPARLAQRRARKLLLDRRRHRGARLRRLPRRSPLRVLGAKRSSPLELRNRKLRLRLARRLARPRPLRLLRPRLLRGLRRLPARCAGRSAPERRSRARPSVVDGFVYFSSFDRRTYALAAASGRLRKEWPDGEYSPAVAGDGRLYLVGLGRLYALAPRAG